MEAPQKRRTMRIAEEKTRFMGAPFQAMVGNIEKWIATNCLISYYFSCFAQKSL
jgi:hypothetical protein